MPRGDRTGPQGAGPMTGRGAGICAGYDVPGYANSSFGRGFGRGRRGGYGNGMGGGRGWRNQYYATGMPGWARVYAGPYGPPVAYAAPVAPAATRDAARDVELAHLKEQAAYFKEALHDIDAYISELKQEPASTDNNPEDKEG